MKTKPTILPGFVEYLPGEQIAFNRMKDTIRRVFELSGFLPLDTPVIEKAEVLLAKGGEEKQIYRFKKGNKELALRFDFTVPLARYVAQRSGDLVFPFKRYQIGKVFRGERSQKGRYREFYQCDVDIVGNGELDLMYDASILFLVYSVFKELGFDDFVIKVGDRKIINKFLGGADVSVLRAIDKLGKNEKQAREELGIRADEIISFIKSDFRSAEGNEDLKKVLDYAKKLGVPEKNISVDLSIVRGLDYYTGMVFETFLDGSDSVCSGGRYDDLAGKYVERKFPGVGLSIGLSRLFSLIKEKGSLIRVLVAPLVDNPFVFEVASAFRSAGINTDVYFDSSVKAKKQFSYADKLGIPFVVVVGEDEVKGKVVTLKDMKTGEQKSVSVEEAIGIVR